MALVHGLCLDLLRELRGTEKGEGQEGGKLRKRQKGGGKGEGENKKGKGKEVLYKGEIDSSD